MGVVSKTEAWKSSLASGPVASVRRFGRFFIKLSALSSATLKEPRGTAVWPSQSWAHEQGEEPMKRLFAFLNDESGATAIEYGLIAAGIAVAIVVVVKNVGTQLNTTLTSVQNGLK